MKLPQCHEVTSKRLRAEMDRKQDFLGSSFALHKV